MHSSSSPSPMRPVAPPAKKQRSSNDAPLRTRPGADRLTSRADDAIARRRAELQRLQQRRAAKSGPASNEASTEGLLARAKTQLAQPSGIPQQPGPAMPRPGTGVSRVRHSDIFPGVSKPPPPPPAAAAPRVARRLDTSFEEEPAPPSSDQKPSRSKSAPPMRPPPPERPPPLLVEDEPTGAGTPHPRKLHNTTTSTTPPSTARREKLSEMRDSAESPTLSSMHTSDDDNNKHNNRNSDVRFVRELKQAQDEKANALRKIARLQDQIARLQQQQQQQKTDTAETNGGMSPNPKSLVSQVGFLSPLTTAASPIRVGGITPGRSRVATPHPKRASANDDHNDKTRQFLAEATEPTPVEFLSKLATYFVRVPYAGVGVPEKNADLWLEAGSQSAEAYRMSADVIKPPTLEVAARIQADDSVLCLSGVSTVRHRNGPNQWRVFDDVDDMDKPLGCVTFIDGNANEQEYWLDAIYEEALATRETYCSSLISTASALQARNAHPATNESHAAGPMHAPGMTTASAAAELRKTVADACVGTDAEVNRDVAPVEPAKSTTQTAATPDKKSVPPPMPLEEETSTDVLSFLLGIVFSSLFGLIWLVLVRTPLHIISVSFVLAVSFSIVSLVWLLLADDHGAELMGAGLPFGFNQPGIV